jgi:hypothetical protein
VSAWLLLYAPNLVEPDDVHRTLIVTCFDPGELCQNGTVSRPPTWTVG